MTLLAQFAATGGGGATYIEDVFSTYLYTGNGSTQTITNGIDLAGKGGLVWTKTRNAAVGHGLVDTVRGGTKLLASETTAAQDTFSGYITAFGATGYTLGASGVLNDTYNMVSWTFREQPKFFDVVTYTGTGSNRTVAHNLGSVPGCIIVKRTDTTSDWQVYHQSNANTQYMVLNDTAAVATGATRWNSTTPTSSVFSLGTDATVNASGGTYVAYLFAHNAGGFGLTGNDNVISCGSFTADGSGNATVTLGYEPQWLLFKTSAAVGSWYVVDNMRSGLLATGASSYKALYPNTSNAEAGSYAMVPTATGFQMVGGDPGTYIYIAIRRGPMKVPTDGTKVFSPQTWTGSTGQVNIPTNFPVDLGISGRAIPGTGHYSYAQSRLAGVGASLRTNTTDAEVGPGIFYGFYMDSNTLAYMPGGNSSQWNATDGGGVGYAQSSWFFQRAPGFFDEVCYTGTGSATTFAHNLAAVPELMIVKSRSNGGGGYDWVVYSSGLTSAANYLILNTTAAQNTGTSTWNNTTPTSSVFSVGASSFTNGSGATYVNYLFATCPGVSKVGSYTGTGTTQTINCGFTAGSRFVLIKRTDSTGDWYVWDSARGIVAGNDPYLLLNSTAAEVTSTDYVDTFAAGFELTATAPAAINASGGTYIFLAIA